MNEPIFNIDSLRQFAADGRVYRAFHHLIAARMGALLLVPLHLVTGRCAEVVDGCPVPWEEVCAVLEYPAVNPLTNPAKWNIGDHAQHFAGFGVDLAVCVLDYIAPLVNGEEKVLRLVHPCGVRYAVAMDNA